MKLIDRKPLIEFLHKQFAINWMGHHGLPHWARVRANGLMLAKETGANVHVVELFAWFHDSRRVNEYVDDGHGRRGASSMTATKPSQIQTIDCIFFHCGWAAATDGHPIEPFLELHQYGPSTLLEPTLRTQPVRKRSSRGIKKKPPAKWPGALGGEGLKTQAACLGAR